MKPEGVERFGLEKVERDSSGIPVEDAPPRVMTEATLLDQVEGSLEVTPAGNVKPSCFVGHTLVYMYGRYGYGQIPIEDVLPGTLVLSRCEKTGELAFKPMVNFFEHEDREIWSVTQRDEEGEETLYTTAEHPFWVQGLGWIPVAQLKPGQLLVTSNPFITGMQDIDAPMKETLAMFGSSTATIVSVKKEEYRAKVYNIEVEDFHTYFVGDLGVWVHNTKAVTEGHRKHEKT